MPPCSENNKPYDMNKFLKVAILLSVVLSFSLPALSRDKEGTAVQDSIPGLEIDSLDVTFDAINTINDYSMIGIQYGVGFSQPSWSPSMQQKMLFVPYNFGILYTRYGKMFGYMPYFGFQAGIFYGQEGYAFEADDEGNTPNVEGATSAVMEVVEIPFMAHCHFDFWKMKLMANIGLYGGYRLSIQRFGENVSPSIANSFLDTDIRYDYGIKAGAGFAFILDPVELHFTVSYKYAFSSLYQPDYYSQYYYRYAYPTNIVVSFGVHFQLTRRTGKSRRALKREAKEQLGIIKSIQNVVEPSSASGNGGTDTEMK